MMLVGILKVIESGKHEDIEEEEGIDEEGLLLESHKSKNGYGATATRVGAPKSPRPDRYHGPIAVLKWQGRNSF